ncbi:MAG: T9SS type A sorting domain-containing protein [Ignavibacteria bacterium]|nr:T9SS type A sorting domain-containing protein [Ignavibacteria bacterium]
MKAINNQNRAAKKQIAVLFMLLFLFASSNILAGNTTNKLTEAELNNSPALTVENNVIFTFNIPAGEYVKFSIYNVKGEEIRVLINDRSINGEISADLAQAFLNNGVYYYSLEAGDYKEVRKLNIYSY